MLDEKVRERQQVLSVLGARCVHQDDGRIPPSGLWGDQRACQPNLTIRELDVLALLDLHPPCDASGRAIPLPAQRGDLASGVTLKLDPSLDGIRERSSRAGAEA